MNTHAALCAVMRGVQLPLSMALVESARHHDVHLLIAQQRASQEDGVSSAVLATALRSAAITDLYREYELRRVLGLLAAGGVKALLLKGAALAYTVYAAPHLRPRGDLDLLIAHTDLQAADQALLAAGWLRAVEHDHESITTQRHYVPGEAARFAENLDLHWKIAVPRVFGDALGFEELASRAVPVRSLGSDALVLSAPDALFLACLHRVAHHGDTENLLWLWDIHLLASSLSDDERTLFADLADQRSMRAVCARGLELAEARFATPCAPDLIATLRQRAGSVDEPSARFLRGGTRQIDLLRFELATAGNWRARLALVSAHLFPNAAYVRAIYPRWPAAALPLAYLDRIVRGSPKWFRRAGE